MRYASLPEHVLTAWPRLSPAAAKVTVALASFMDKAGRCYPGREAIMAKAGIRRRNTFAGAIRELEGKGLIVLRRRFQRTRYYSWTAEALVSETDTSDPQEVSESDTLTAPKGIEKRAVKVSQNDTLNNTKEQKTLSRRTATKDGAAFDVFWTAYPRKVAKTAAKKAWAKINPGPELVEQMLAALEVQGRSDQWTRYGGKFVPYPATWLNGERWLDETIEAAGPSAIPSRDPTAEDLAVAFGRASS